MICVVLIMFLVPMFITLFPNKRIEKRLKASQKVLSYITTFCIGDDAIQKDIRDMIMNKLGYLPKTRSNQARRVKELNNRRNAEFKT